MNDGGHNPVNGGGGGLAVGIALGVALGTALGNVGVGIAIGVAIGVALGAAQRRMASTPPDDEEGDPPGTST
jgi:hypothetical protein